MKKLRLTVQIDSKSCPATQEHGDATADVVSQLRQLADFIEGGGLTGSPSHLPGQTDCSGVPRTRYELNMVLGTGGAAAKEPVAGPQCPPSLPPIPSTVVRVETLLDAIMHATACVFPADLYAAAHENAAMTGDWGGIECAQAFSLIRNRTSMSLLQQFNNARGPGLETDMTVIARALARQMERAGFRL